MEIENKENKELLTTKDYQSAIDVQSACNLSGIVFSFAKVMKRICNERAKGNHGTDWVNTHPIAQMYAVQILHLTKECSYTEAYNICEQKSK